MRRSVFSRRKRIPSTFVILVLGLTLIAATWVTVAVRDTSERAAELERVHRENDVFARAFEEHVRRVFTTADNALLFLKHEYEQHGGLTEAMAGFVERGRRDPILNQVAVVDAAGSLVLSALPRSRPINVSRNETFQVHVRDPHVGLFVGKPIRTQIAGTWSCFLTRMAPIFRPCALANSIRSGSRAMVPSSLWISQITAAGSQPARWARSQPASVICEILKDDGTMAQLPDLIEFAGEHKLKIGTIRDLIHYRSENEKLVECVADKEISCGHGSFRLRAFEDKTTGEVHLAMTQGEIRADAETLVRVHEPISVLDFLDCASHRHSFTVDQAMAAIARAKSGVIVLLHRKESGHDLIANLKSEENCPAAKWDPRLYGIGAQILRELGVGKMRLMASPRKMPSMAGFGLEICGYLSPEEAKA